MPCGRCRQLLCENGGPELELLTGSRRTTDGRGAAGCVRSRRPRLTSETPDVRRGPLPVLRRGAPAPRRSPGTRPSGTYLTFDHAERVGGAAQPRPRPGLARPRARGVPRAVQPAPPQPDDGERAAGAHPAAAPGGRGVQPRAHRAAPAPGAGAGGRAARRPSTRRRSTPSRTTPSRCRCWSSPSCSACPRCRCAAAARLVAGDRADVRAVALRRGRRTRPWRAAPDFAALVRELADERRTRAPGRPDQRPASRPSCRRDEVVASAVLLLNAGHEASVNVFGNGLVALLDARAATG